MSLQPLTFPVKILAAPLKAAGTRLIMPNINHWDFADSAGVLLASEVGTVMFATLMDFARTKMEVIELDPSTLTVATTTGILINKRACGFAGGTTAGVETAYDWTPNETFIMLGTNPPQLIADLVDLNEAQTITGKKTFPSSEAARARVDVDGDTAVNEAFITFGQLARQAIAGAADASETVAGLVEQATLAETLAGTESGSLAKLFVTPLVLQQILQGQASTYLVEDGVGADDAYTTTATPTITTYTTGQVFTVKFAVANTGACTLDIDGIAVTNIKKWVDGAKADLETGDIIANFVAMLEYDGTDFMLLSMTATIPTTALLSEMATFFTAFGGTGAEVESMRDGSNVDALHNHTLEALLKNTTRSIILLDEDTATTDAGLAAHTRQPAGGSFTTSGASGGSFLLKSNTGAFISDFDKDCTISIWILLDNVSARDSFIGIGAETDAGDIQEDHVLTKRHVAFMVDDATLIASMADGTTQETALSLATIVADAWNLLTIEWVAGVGGTFYLNGTQVASLTTQLPSGQTDACWLRVGCEGDSGAKNVSYRNGAIISIEP